jgi:hypothetical protein
MTGLSTWVRSRTRTIGASVTTRERALWATAVLRIGYGSLFVILLLRHFPQREVLWGPGSPWTIDLARAYLAQTPHWLGMPFGQSHTLLTVSSSPFYFELVYLTAIVVGVLFALGYRTRVTAWLFLLAVASFYVRNPFVTDGGDNVLMLMAIYLPFTACGRRLSLDARRAAPHEQRTVADRLVTLAHNCTAVVIAAQMCFLYGTAGLLKVGGSRWQEGTALYYVLNLRNFQVWPGLSRWLAGNAIVIVLASYLVVFLQAGFPFAVFGKRLKYAFLLGIVAMHVGIAVVLGLPAFSAAILIGDAIFLPDPLYRSWLRWSRAPVDRRRLITPSG